MFRERLSRAGRRPFSLATELRVLAVGLFAVAGGAAWLDMSQRIAPVEVLGAAGVIVVVFAVNVAFGLLSARRNACEAVAEGVEN